MSPEEEAKQLEQQIRAAQASGDISAIIKILAKTSEITPADFIKKTLGEILFVYYVYLEYFHQRPIDLEDLVNGLLFMDTRSYLRKHAGGV